MFAISNNVFIDLDENDDDDGNSSDSSTTSSSNDEKENQSRNISSAESLSSLKKPMNGSSSHRCTNHK